MTTHPGPTKPTRQALARGCVTLGFVPNNLQFSDLVLARAVRRQVITRDEAELIGMTRLEGIGIAQLAAANGYQLGALYLRGSGPRHGWSAG
jgi:hypothetical protein